MPVRRHLHIEGIVQGVGFRPFVYQLATSLELTGWVLNSSEGVSIEVEGAEPKVEDFARRVVSDAPPLASIRRIEANDIPIMQEEAFVIRKSLSTDTASARLPADVAVCSDCAREMADPSDRRYGYPFTNCTNCGPRFTIIEGIPYDRPFTTMHIFPMCPECREEYENPLNRRFHAQPNACSVCGPSVRLEDEPSLASEASIRRVGELLRAGRIVAIKGLGGFHLACDARNAEAVRALRDRKGRGAKPFALMCADLDEIRRICCPTAEEAEALLSPEHPIVLLEAVSGTGIAPEVAPGYHHLGIMLPYTPLHRLLMQAAPKTLVMTSGNLSEEPICYRNEESFARLSSIADAFLTHNPEIAVPCDDSVMRFVQGKPAMIRRARGFVPRPIPLGFETAPILACGGQQKNTFCLAQGSDAMLSQHIGDLDNLETLTYFKGAIEHFKRLFRVKPEIVACDMHPDYLSSRYARSLEGVALTEIQHHHAHIAAAMVEHQLRGEVIGVAFDGTGYGPGGGLWGGEVLLCDYLNYRRFACLEPVPLPGGEAAIRRPARMALSYLIHAFGDEAKEIAKDLLPALSKEEVAVVGAQIARRLNAPLTSGMGRLFDAAAALTGLCQVASYEGQGAVQLETFADGSAECAYPYELHVRSDLYMIHIAPLIRSVVEDRRQGKPTGEIATRFHRAIEGMIIRLCHLARKGSGLSRVVLSGGVFQNRWLLDCLLSRLPREGFDVFIPQQVPANDGGIALGQAAIAGHRRNAGCV